MSLPSGYRKLEYIQSSGTQYIDTGFKPNQNTRLIADVEILNVPHSQLLGARIASGNASFNILVSSKTAGRDDYNETALNFAAGAARWKIDKNKNVTTVNGTAVSHPAGTFQTTCSIFINAVNTNGSPMSTTTGSARWRSVQIYDNGRLVRDFIPCKTAAGVVGLWDDVNSVFYQNTGTGTFTAGPEIKGTHKTFVSGTAYDAKSGRCTINGTSYAVKKGRTLIGGTGYNLQFTESVLVQMVLSGDLGYVVIDGNTYGPGGGSVSAEAEVGSYAEFNAKTPYSFRVYLNGSLIHSGQGTAYRYEITEAISISVNGSVTDLERAEFYITTQ